MQIWARKAILTRICDLINTNLNQRTILTRIWYLINTKLNQEIILTCICYVINANSSSKAILTHICYRINTNSNQRTISRIFVTYSIQIWISKPSSHIFCYLVNAKTNTCEMSIYTGRNQPLRLSFWMKWRASRPRDSEISDFKSII